jgi:hypothetical protein
MTSAEAAQALLALADRIDRLRPLSSDPEKYFVDRGEVVADLLKVARELDPRGAAEKRGPKPKFTPGTLIVGGRRVPVERRGARRARGTGDETARAFR